MERTPAKNTHLRYDEDGSAVSAAQFVSTVILELALVDGAYCLQE